MMMDQEKLEPVEESRLSIRIYVVDDDPASRESLYLFLRSQGRDAERFESANDFLDAVDIDQPACLITDLKMPGTCGLELQEELARRGSDMPVIVVSGYADVTSAVRAMKNGAITLLEKPYSEEDLANAVSEAVRRVATSYDRDRRRKRIEVQLETLTDGEREIMDLLLQGSSNKTIASKLDYGLRTVERRRHILLEKMNVSSLPELARLVAEVEIGAEVNGRN